MATWFRFYTEALDDPKVQTLAPELFKFWINTLSLASRSDGYLPDFGSVSFAFRIPESEVHKSFQKLLDLGLLDEKRGRLSPHNWFKRQYKSDVSTPRVKQFRERKVKRFISVTETPSETDTEQRQRQIQNRRERDGEAAMPPVPVLKLGEAGYCILTEEQHAKLQALLNGKLQHYIDRFDRFVSEAPEAKTGKGNVRRKDRRAYQTILNWHDTDVKEGNSNGQHRSAEQNPRGSQPKIFGAIPPPYTPKSRTGM